MCKKINSDTFLNLSGNSLSTFKTFIQLERIHIKIKILLRIHMYLEQLFKNKLSLQPSHTTLYHPCLTLKCVLKNDLDTYYYIGQ